MTTEQGAPAAPDQRAPDDHPSGDLAPGDLSPLGAAPTRIASLDFIRGLAVMGILAANIVAFGQPMTAYMYPDAFTTPHGPAEDWMWVAQFVLVDGKMRGLFTLLFGAGMYLFMERAWARGASRWLQVRRLVWLGLFGLAHYFFIWRGDILFLYAAAGLPALLFLRLTAKRQMLLGVLGYLFGALLYTGMLGILPIMAAGPPPGEEDGAAMAEGLEASKQADLADGRLETELTSAGDYGALVAHRFAEHSGELAMNLLVFWFETLPLMLMGMALYRMGLFDGGIDARRLRLWGWVGLAIGGVPTLLVALWAKADDFSYYGTLAAFTAWSMIPRLFMTLGLAALLSLWGASASGWLARRVSAAGRAAFTNYLGTSVVMMLVFHGWAGGLFGELTRGQLYLVVIAAWVLMLAWSQPWLARFRYGPLEWLWRCLTYGRLFEMRR